MDELGIRRNDYIAGIRSQMFEARENIRNYPKSLQDAKDLITYCKINRLHNFKKVIKLEIKVLKKSYKMNKKLEKNLQKLLYTAERYTPGAREVQK